MRRCQLACRTHPPLLALNDGLYFEVVGAYVGVKAIIIHYRNHVGRVVCEMVRFGDDGLIAEGHATHLA